MGTELQFPDARGQIIEASGVLARLAVAGSGSRQAVLTEFIRDLLVEFLELDGPGDVADDQNFAELGADSMQAVDFKVELEKRLKCALRSTVLFDYPSLDLLTRYLLDEVLVFAEVSPVDDSLDSMPTPKARQVAELDPFAIAVVGMAGIFPEAENAAALWRKVVSGSPLQVTSHPGKSELTYGRVDPGRLQALEWLKISRADFSALPRQEQLLYQCIEDALHDYRLDLSELIKSTTAVYIGSRDTVPTPDVAYQVPLANKVSFQLNLKGPSETINTFCTSVYVALHRAIQSLRAGECQQALVGGVNVIGADEFTEASRQGLYRDILSPDNQTKSFGDAANGYLRSEGAGVLIVKPLADAVRDGNAILGLVKGSAVYHGGRGYSFEAPNSQGLKGAIRLCLTRADLDSDSIDYVEAHGIGNLMADALELGAIDQAYRQAGADSAKRWHISSVKPSIGHPEAASGIASIIKVLKAFEHGVLPGVAGLEAINSDFPAGHALTLQHENRPWPGADRPKRAALNSYAIGGVNAHIVLEEYRPDAEAQPWAAGHSAPVAANPLDGLNLDSPTLAIVAKLVKDIFKLDLASLDLSLSLIDYGFDSIDVVQFVGRLNESLDLDIKFSQVLGIDDFAGFFDLLARQQRQKRQVAHDAGTAQPLSLSSEIRGPLSEVQKGLWYVNQLAPESIAFNVPLTFKVPGGVDIPTLEQALAAMLAEYPLLRAAISQRSDTGESEQVIRPLDEGTHCHEIRLESAALLDTCLWSLLRQPFELSKDALVRLYAIDAADAGTYVFFVIHHIVFDGTSGALFIAAFWRKYHALLAGETLVRQTPDLAFLDYVEWERRYLAGNAGDEDRRWWRELLADQPATLNLPYDRLPQASLSADGIGCQKFTLDDATLAALKQLATRCKTSLAVLFLAIFQVFLNKLTQESAVTVTTPVRGRPKQAHEQSIGCYINVMVVPGAMQTELAFVEWVKQTRRQFFDCLDHAHYPFPRLLADLGLNLANPKENPFPVSYTYQNFFDELLNNADALQGVETLYDVFQQTEDHYTLEIYDFRQSLQINIKYKRSLFDDATITRHLACFKQLLTSVIADPEQAIGGIEMLPPAERQRLLIDFNATPTTPIGDFCIHDLFVRQALKTPELVAVIGEDRSLSYRELHEQSDRLAVYLQQLGVQADTIVAVCLRRSPLMLVGLLGILKAGGAYLPLDANTPVERSKALLSDSGARLLLTEAGLAAGLAEIRTGPAIQTVALDSDWPLIAQSTGQPRASAGPEHLAYLIYTSGSTGQPKGVMVEHRNVVNHNLAVIAAYSLSEHDRVLQFSTISFDIFVEEVFPTLLSGGAVVMMDGERFTDVAYLKSLLQRHRVSLINLPTAYWHTLVEQDFSDTALSRVVIGGEKAEAQKYRAWRQRNPNIAVINTYGPTETTVISLLHPIDPAHDPDQAIPLGKPLANTQVYVLDSALKPVPIGVPGELHIAGAGVARGYLNQPELTAEKFIANPFGAGKLYKTGDLVRWLDDGNLAFLGRRDHQVKIRGFRVELGEIETALARHPAVKLPVLVVSERQNNKQLLAFYTHDGNPPEQEALKAFLRETLPEYMVPLALIAVEVLPMTAGGKIDRNALARQASGVQTGNADFSPPRGQLEQQLAEIWRALLNIERVGVNDNFFELGGHSLLTVQLISRINAILPDSSLNLADIFKYPTIKALTDYLERPMEKLTNSAYLLNLRSGIPTFIVPGMPGLSDGYFELAECLKREGPVYGLQMKGYSDEPPATTVEDMAAHNIAQIKSVWPQGRINLYAHSYGGTVVYEMLRQLQESTYEIGEVVLIDSGLLLRQSSVDKTSVKAFCNFMLTNAGISPEPYRGAIAEILKTKPYAEWKDCFASLLADIVPNLDAGHFRKIWQVTEASITANYRYTAKLPYCVTLVIAEGSKGWLAANEWNDYYQAVNVIKAKGEHFTVVKQPYCAAWLRELSPEPAAQPSTLPAPSLAEPDANSSLLSVRGLEKHYGEVKAVAGVSFELQAGTCFGLLGPNGAGKTSTLEMMEGILKPSKGDILFRGKPIDRRYSQHIGIQFQHTALPETLTVKECLQLFQKLYPHSLPLEDIVEACALQDYLNRDSRKLSGGQRQRLLLGIALINDPDILFLDEPTTGLDPQSRHNFWSLIRDIKQRGKTIVLTTHYMEEAEQLCDEIAIMDQGRIIVQDTPENLLQEYFDGVLIRLPRASGLTEIPGLPFAVSAGDDTVEFVTANVEAAIAQLTRLNISLEGLTVATPNLENLFLKLTGHSLRS